MAQGTASTTLRNSMMLPSPVRFTTRPLWTLMVGAIRSLQSVRSRQRTFLVAAREAAEADHVNGKDSGKLSLFGHGGVTLRPSETGESLR